jgi:predicted metal-binding protein/2-polyprenyl-3-methyl-5-hydroxy-6-metoxy-1,4-benzoquinol methylase
MRAFPFRHDPQESGAQYLEDLATGYWFSEVIFTAVELDIFSRLDPAGSTAARIARTLEFDTRAVERFLEALHCLGLVTPDEDGAFHNTNIASNYLVKGKECYQGNSVLWRKFISNPWKNLKESLRSGGRIYDPVVEKSEQLAGRVRGYISAMDDVATAKTRDIISLFDNVSGNILDVGAGSGAVSAGFLERFPAARATLIDLPEVLDYTARLPVQIKLGDRVTFCPANILEPWPVGKKGFDLVVLSNVLHAYAQTEAVHLLDEACQCLNSGGLLVVHDFFREHCPEKAALFDLNMLLNTYNGRIFSAKWVCGQLESRNLHVTGLVPLASDTGLIVGAVEAKSLAKLCLDPVSLLLGRMRDLGFRNRCAISTDSVHVPDWTPQRCQFGCIGYGKPHCPPNSPTPSETRQVLQDYSKALLLEGEPPLRAFQMKVLQAEKEAFTAGFYKALAYWAGPCSICKQGCPGDGICRNNRMARPSMEAAGIDVFETVRRAGLSLRTLKNKNGYAKYFALLLLE